MDDLLAIGPAFGATASVMNDPWGAPIHHQPLVTNNAVMNDPWAPPAASLQEPVLADPWAPAPTQSTLRFIGINQLHEDNLVAFLYFFALFKGTSMRNEFGLPYDNSNAVLTNGHGQGKR